MNDGFLSMNTAPRDGAVFAAQMVSMNVYDIRWMDEHQAPYGDVLVPAGWCDALTLLPVQPLGWRAPEQADPDAAEHEDELDFRTVGDLADYLATLPRDLLVVLASDGEGNELNVLADRGQYRIWNDGEIDILDEEDAKSEGHTDEEIAASTIPVVILWPTG